MSQTKTTLRQRRTGRTLTQTCVDFFKMASLPSRSRRKRLSDIVLASGALVFFAPLMGIIYLVVRRDGGQAIFAQKRIGQNGEMFHCYKFRTMVPNAEETLKRILETDPIRRREWEADRKFTDDPRITKVGNFLRRKSLDELPQLWNVIRGEMSVVGPRPIVPDERSKYGDQFEYYMQCRPGLTGAWQVSGRNDTTYDERVALDANYAQSWTFKKDAKIIFLTFGAVLAERGAR